MPAQSSSAFALRRHLVILVVAAVAPVVIFATIMVVVFGRGERASTERGLRETARALTLAVDREVETSIKALEALAASPYLDTDDYAAFARHAARVLPTQPWWRVIILTDARGGVIFTSGRAGALPNHPPLSGDEHFVEMARTLRPALSDVLRDRARGAPTISLVVPVVRDGRLREGLAAELEPAALSQFLFAQSLRADWTATIVGRDGHVLARSRDLATWVGRPAGPLLTGLRGSEGWTRGADGQGVDAYAAYARARVSGWTVALAVPADTVDAALGRSLVMAIVGGLALLMGGAGLAAVVGRRVARPILGLAEAAEALGAGRTPESTTSAVEEVNRVSAALETAARERDRYDRALRDSQAQLRAIFASMLDAIVVLDDDTRWVDANPAAEELFGMAREDLRGRAARDFVVSETDIEATWRDLRTKGTLLGGFRLQRPDGTLRDVEYAATADVLPGRHVAVMRDVTARRQSDEDLRRSQREAMAVADLARRINESLDLDEVLRLVCEAARDVCGADAATIALPDPESPGVMTLRHRVPPMEVPPDVNRIERGKGIGGLVIRTGRPFRSLDYAADTRVTRDYATLGALLGTVAVMVVPILDGTGVVGLLYVANRSRRPFGDADEAILVRLADQAALAIRNARLLAREQGARAGLEAANRSKDDFLATLSHELRTPLTAMLGWVRMLRSAKLTPEQAARALETIERNTLWQANLINDLLDVSRIVSGKMQLDRQVVDLVAVAGDAVETLRRDADAKGVALGAVLGSTAAVVNGDGLRLSQVIANLVSNAIKFTPSGGRVVVELARAGDQALLSVRDTGAGIDPELLPHVFDRFRQGERSRGGGLGLGLAIVRHIVSLHGGTVEARSEGTGKGATFVVSLPLSVVPRIPVAATGVAKSGTGRTLEGMRILAVDDHPDARELVRLALADRGAEVRTAGSVDEALAALDAAAVDVIVSDLGMPGADGLALVSQMRARERAAGSPPAYAIALTAYASREDRAQALAAGFNLHIAKPVDPDALIDAVTGALRRG
jgi:PAS domain S-box-containing protein